MKSGVMLCSFLLVLCTFCGGAVAAGNTRIATTGYVENRIVKSSGAIELQNDANNVVTVKNNPTASGLDTNSKTVITVGWTDTNRTSKVKTIDGNSTSLVDMWIE